MLIKQLITQGISTVVSFLSSGYFHIFYDSLKVCKNGCYCVSYFRCLKLMKEFNKHDTSADDYTPLLILFLVYFSPLTFLA